MGAPSRVSVPLGHSGGDADLPEGVAIGSAQGRSGLKVGVGDAGDAAGRQHAGGEPDGQGDEKGAGRDDGGEADHRQGDPGGGGDRAEHPDQRIDPVPCAFAEANGYAGQHTGHRTADPTGHLQAQGVEQALAQKRSVFHQDSEDPVQWGEVEHGEGGGLRCQNVQHTEKEKDTGSITALWWI